MRGNLYLHRRRVVPSLLSKIDQKLQSFSRNEKLLGVVSGVINANLWLQKNNEYIWQQMFSSFNLATASKLKEVHEELYRLERSCEYYEDRVRALESKINEKLPEVSKVSKPRVRAKARAQLSN